MGGVGQETFDNFIPASSEVGIFSNINCLVPHGL